MNDEAKTVPVQSCWVSLLTMLFGVDHVLGLRLKFIVSNIYSRRLWTWIVTIRYKKTPVYVTVRPSTPSCNVSKIREGERVEKMGHGSSSRKSKGNYFERLWKEVRNNNPYGIIKILKRLTSEKDKLCSVDRILHSNTRWSKELCRKFYIVEFFMPVRPLQCTVEDIHAAFFCCCILMYIHPDTEIVEPTSTLVPSPEQNDQGPVAEPVTTLFLSYNFAKNDVINRICFCDLGHIKAYKYVFYSHSRLYYVYTGCSNLIQTFHGGTFELLHQLFEATPLMLASAQDVRNVKFLINNGADVNKCNSLGVGPLHYAALAGNDEAISYLIGHGANIDLEDKWGNTALMYCLMFSASIQHDKFRACLEKLITAGASLNLQTTVKSARYGVSNPPKEDCVLIWLKQKPPSVWRFLQLLLLLENGFPCSEEVIREIMSRICYQPYHAGSLSEHHRLTLIVILAGSSLHFHLAAQDYLHCLVTFKSIQRCSIFREWLKYISENPSSLKHLCRLKIIHQIFQAKHGRSVKAKVKQLPLPRSLVEYVDMKDLSFAFNILKDFKLINNKVQATSILRNNLRDLKF